MELNEKDLEKYQGGIKYEDAIKEQTIDGLKWICENPDAYVFEINKALDDMGVTFDIEDVKLLENTKNPDGSDLGWREGLLNGDTKIGATYLYNIRNYPEGIKERYPFLFEKESDVSLYTWVSAATGKEYTGTSKAK